MRIGIIGTGKIASAIVTGFCAAKAGHEFCLSPRGADTAASLAARFSEAKVCSSNQEVLDKSEWVFISVQKSAFGALRELKFRRDHKILNMAAEMRLPDLKEITGETALMAHVIPLPMIALGFGPILVYPEVTEVGELFASVGDVFYTQSLSEVHILQIITGVMSPYYMLLDEVVKFADERGMDHDFSVRFVHSLFSAVSRRAAETPNCDLVELANDMTPGGYNQQAMGELLVCGAVTAWRDTLDRLMERLQAGGQAGK